MLQCGLQEGESADSRHRRGCFGLCSNSRDRHPGPLGGFWDALGRSPQRRLLHPLALTSLDRFPYAMHIRGLIRYHQLAQRERSQYGKLGKYLKTLLPTFMALSSGPAEIADDNVAVLEHFNFAV